MLTIPGSGDVRPTDDIDLVVEAETYSQYQQIVDGLRKRHGFEHDMNGPLCRFSVRGVTVDVMPTEESVLRFCNKWYRSVIEHANSMTLQSGRTIRVVSPPVFLCTKLEAFADRGNSDYFGSSDIEDIVALMDGRASLIAECRAASPDVRNFLSESFSQLFSTREFMESLEGLLPLGSERGLKRVVEKLRTLALVK